MNPPSPKTGSAITAATSSLATTRLNVSSRWRESCLVRMRFAGESQRHHGAAVESVFKRDDAGTLGVSAGDLHCILYGFSAAVHEDSFLRKVARRDIVHALGQPDVA